MSRLTVSSRARRLEDRGGDPLDGLVNLFDLGIVLAVAFLIAALSSLDLTAVLTDRATAERASQAVSENSVVIDPDEAVRQMEIDPGQRVVGEGRQIGRLYRLADGRVVVVGPSGAQGGPSGSQGGNE